MVFLEKLKVFPEELIARQKTADAYNEGFKDIVTVPYVMKDVTSTWAQYTIRLPKHINRAQLMADLKAKGIPSVVYYVKPLHLQTAYKHYPTATGGALPVCEALANEVLSLPMSGYVESDEITFIINEIKTYA